MSDPVYPTGNLVLFIGVFFCCAIAYIVYQDYKANKDD